MNQGTFSDYHWDDVISGPGYIDGYMIGRDWTGDVRVHGIFGACPIHHDGKTLGSRLSKN